MQRAVGKRAEIRAGRLMRAALLVGLLASATGAGATSGPLDIPFQRFVLDNGLVVIVHENRDAPIVAVQVWYRVGSKDERPGKTGFAHLFEHLMFNGSENLDQDWFLPLEEAGATSMNGTTNWDRTNYFQTVPTSALDRALWMESDRMGHLLGAITQDKLDEQRGVVQNEKRQRENRPYGQAWNLLSRASFPSGHPYSWSVIGSMDDLNAASLEDVHEWFRSYYGAANAVLVLAGDIDAATAREMTERYFGDIPAGPPVARHARWIAKRTGAKRQIVRDRVPQSRVYKAWNTAPLGTPDASSLELAAQILAGDKNSRLYKRLVYEEQIATSVSAYYYGRELAGWFVIEVDAQPGLSLDAIEAALEEELATFARRGPNDAEMDRARVTLRAEFVRGLEQLGGFHGVSGILAAGEVHEGDPAAYRGWLNDLETTTRKDVRSSVREWLDDGVYTLEIHPFPDHQHASKGVDRSALPALGDSPNLRFPALQRAVLGNGLQVILAERHSLPLVEFELLVDAGYAADQNAKLGTSAYTLSMLKEGTRRLDALALADREARLGAIISTHSTLDTSSIRLSALRENLEESVELYSKVVLEPAFDEREIERKRARWLAKILQEKSSPRSVALRTLLPLLYGDDHAYSIPLTGSGTEESIRSLTRDDLVGFAKRWLRPDNATLIVVGDVTLKELSPLLEKTFGGWESPVVATPSKKLDQVELPGRARVYLIDRPGAEQSVIIAGQLAPPIGAGNYDATEFMNRILGGSFTSRLNMNLREDKHWSYGARSTLIDAQGQRPLFALAPVQTDKTSESMQEILKEFREYRSNRPATDEEIERARSNSIRKLPGRYETNASVLRSLAKMTRFGWPDDYVVKYRSRIEALGNDQIRAAAKQILRPEELTWLVVGDLAVIEPGIRALELGELTILDANGVPQP